MVYLNNVEAGGGTRFFEIHHTFMPAKGQAVVWNNLHRDGTVNPDTAHAGTPVQAGHKIIIISHRPDFAVNDTLEWLSHHQLPLAGIHLLTSMEPKSIVQPACDVYVDDKVENCIDLSINVKPKPKLVALFDQPWNQAINKDWSVERVFGWDDFVSCVGRMK